MKITAKSVLSRQRNSFEAVRGAALEIAAAMPAPPKLVLCYLTVNHAQEQFLAGLREVLGPSVPVVGCSGQGVMGRGAWATKRMSPSVLLQTKSGHAWSATRASKATVYPAPGPLLG